MTGTGGKCRGLVAAIGVAASAIAASSFEVAAAEPGSRSVALAALRGPVERVRDGDTIELEGRAIRLQGVAAPELHDPLGEEARAALRDLVLGRTVACVPDGTRTRGRIVALCTVDGRDLGAALVAAGLARDCPRFSGGRYADLERAAAARGAPIGKVYPLPNYCRPKR